jgi:hypothetical protein
MASPSAYSNPAGVGPVVSPKTSPSSRRLARPVTLGPIDENGGMGPDIPQRSQYRPMARFLHTFQPSGAREPPPYTAYNDVTGPRGEKFSDVRNNRHVAKRGGWTRVLLIALIVLLLMAGLGVGLGVGLTRSKSARYFIDDHCQWALLTSLHIVPHRLRLRLRPQRLQLHFQPDHTPLKPIFQRYQQAAPRIRTRGDAIRTQHILKRVRGPTLHLTGS